MNIFESAMKFLTENAGVIGTVLGVLFTVSKAVSNEKAGPVVSKLQGFFDLAYKLVSGLGSVLKFISDVLANLIKSDGTLGKK